MGHGPGALLRKPARTLPGIRKGQGAHGSPEETGASGLTGCGRGFAAWRSWGLWTGAGSSAVLTWDKTRNPRGQPLTRYADGRAEVSGCGRSRATEVGPERPSPCLAILGSSLSTDAVPKTRPVAPTAATKRLTLQKGPCVSRKRRKTEFLV